MAMSEPHPQSLAQWLAHQKHAAGPAVIGLNGAQGTGKSTLAQTLKEQLSGQFELRVVFLSIDDLYLTRGEREHLSQTVHPLLRTRGVPGTHDVALGLRVIEALGQPGAVRLPRFIKAIDDRAPESSWPVVEGPVDLILFEGWCVGTPPQTDEELREPVNPLEALEDPDGSWRRYVNRQLATIYPRLFSRIDRMIFLQAPDFDSIHRWRLEQEQKNALALASVPPASGAEQSRLMGREELRRFIQHYERLTRHALAVMPQRADVVIGLGADHETRSMRFR